MSCHHIAFGVLSINYVYGTYISRNNVVQSQKLQIVELFICKCTFE
jgi:hypothetical protein